VVFSALRDGVWMAVARRPCSPTPILEGWTRGHGRWETP
jgi:hypothetical protein